jgi:hypothetical protein
MLYDGSLSRAGGNGTCPQGIEKPGTKGRMAAHLCMAFTDLLDRHSAVGKCHKVSKAAHWHLDLKKIRIKRRFLLEVMERRKIFSLEEISWACKYFIDPIY